MLTVNQFYVLIATGSVPRDYRRACNIAALIINVTHSRPQLKQTVYATLASLTDKHLIKRDIDAHSGYPVYTVTARGRKAMIEMLIELETMSQVARTYLDKEFPEWQNRRLSSRSRRTSPSSRPAVSRSASARARP